MSLTKRTFFTIAHVKADIMPDEGIVRLEGLGPFASVALSRLGSKHSDYNLKFLYYREIKSGLRKFHPF